MSSHPSNKQLPRDAIVMQALLKEMGVTSHEPRVVNQMLEFVYRYITNVVDEARVYSNYAKKKTVDVDDIRLAIKEVTDKAYTTVPPREMLLDLAKTKNTQPLPLIKSSSGLRLPPDRYCLTQPNYQLQFYKRAVASSNIPAVANVRLPGSPAVFKTPIATSRSHNTSAGGANSAAKQDPVQSAFGSQQPIIQYSAAGASTPTGRALQGQSQGVKRKLSEDTEDNSFVSF